LWAALALLSAACTDWNSDGSGGPWVQSSSGSAGADQGPDAAGTAGLKAWDTWKAPEVGADASPDAGADAGTGDAEEAIDSYEPATADTADGALADTGLADTDDAAATYTLDGKGDFVGWPELPVDVPPPDTAVEPDAFADSEADAPADTEADIGVDAQADTEADIGVDAQADVEADAGVDTQADVEADAGVDTQADIEADAGFDTQADVEADAGVDAQVDTEADTSVDTQVDTQVDADLDALADAQPDAVADSGGDTAADGGSLPDGAMAPDWQGYPDLPYSADADIYGGAIGSCLSMYLYQQEFCGVNNPTADCIASVAKDGSLFAQFQFEPLRECQTAVCTDLCAAATDKACMEGCIVNYCAAPFLACTSNGAQGGQSCADAWKCSKQYPDKLLTISAKCYSAASPVAQQQFSAVIGCVGEPQSDVCITEVAACFADPASPTQSCSATLTCMNGCNNDEICNFTCLGKANAQAVSLIDDIWSCQLNLCVPKCAGSADPACTDDCLKNECQSQLVQCLVN
jgi:hypothetical protein